jgi:hypothetical protein
MSHKQNPPRQDRRGIGRSVIRDHAGAASVGHDRGNVTGGFGSAPNAKANAKFNEAARVSGEPGKGATPGQIVGSGIKLT